MFVALAIEEASNIPATMYALSSFMFRASIDQTCAIIFSPPCNAAIPAQPSDKDGVAIDIAHPPQLLNS
jgi:hypothetical protein